jgi:hypothetical protein
MKSFVIGLVYLVFVKCSELYKERLDIYSLPNNYFLNNFTFTFTIKSDQ